MTKLVPLILLLLLVACGLKSEDALRQQFAQNKSAISQILEMQSQDPKVVRIAPTFTWLDTDMSWPRKNLGFSEERWEQYRVLFRKAKIADGIVFRNGAVWYYVSSIGLAIGGASRGFVHSENPLTPVVASLDQCVQKDGSCYVSLEGHWYLFQEVN
jgi:hypothetical protein